MLDYYTFFLLDLDRRFATGCTVGVVDVNQKKLLFLQGVVFQVLDILALGDRTDFPKSF
jgi:hypothetical protein